MSEHDEQVGLFEWAGFNDKLRWLFAIPNGGHRHKAVAIKLKREGVRAGVWDIFLPIPSEKYHGLFMEMKYGKNNLTDKQKEFGIFVRAKGYKTAVAYNWEEAQQQIEDYLNNE